jgi:hypothetical protein
MEPSLNCLPCDGCGLPASPQHIANRVRRLEFATRFRPVHNGILFIALAPSLRVEDDFYSPAKSKELTDPLLEALEIQTAPEKAGMEGNADAGDSPRLAEFQRRGYYLAYLSECPLPENEGPAASTIARLGPTLIRRIKFNYRPKHIAPLGQELFPLVEILKNAGIGPVLTLDHRLALLVPGTGDQRVLELFRRAIAAVSPRENLSPGYDRIQLTQTERDLGAGGNT